MDLVRTENILGSQKVVVGDSQHPLILGNNGTIYVQNGNRYLKLSEAVGSGGSSGATIINESPDLSKYSNGTILYNTSTKTLSVVVGGSEVVISSEDLFIKKSGDEVSGVITFKSAFKTDDNSMISNLNADLLDGKHAEDFVQELPVSYTTLSIDDLDVETINGINIDNIINRSTSDVLPLYANQGESDCAYPNTTATTYKKDGESWVPYFTSCIKPGDTITDSTGVTKWWTGSEFTTTDLSAYTYTYQEGTSQPRTYNIGDKFSVTTSGVTTTYVVIFNGTAATAVALADDTSSIPGVCVSMSSCEESNSLFDDNSKFKLMNASAYADMNNHLITVDSNNEAVKNSKDSSSYQNIFTNGFFHGTAFLDLYYYDPNLTDGSGTALDDSKNKWVNLSETMSGIQEKLDTLIESVVAITEVVNGMSTEVETINTNVGTMQTDVATIKTDISDCKSKVTTIDSNVSTIKSDVTTVKSDVSTIKTDLTTVKTDVATNKTNINTANTNINTIKSVVNEIKNAVVEIESDVALIKTDMGL